LALALATLAGATGYGAPGPWSTRLALLSVSMLVVLLAMRTLPGWTLVCDWLMHARQRRASAPSATLRVMVLHSSASVYGSDNALLALMTALKRRLGERFEAIVVVPEDGPLVERLRGAGIEVLRAPLAVLHRTLSPTFWLHFVASAVWTSQQLARLARRRGIQLVHSNTSHVVNGAWLARRAGVPHLWQVREINLWQSPVGRSLHRLVARSADLVVCVSQATREQFEIAGTRSAEVAVVYDGLALEHYDPALRSVTLRTLWGFDDRHFVVGLVGRIVEWKGHRVFVAAAKRVLARCPDVRFVVVGAALTASDRAFEAELRKEARDLGAALYFAGENADVATVMASLDAVAMTSVQPEPWGLVTLEAMASCRPVVATRHGGPLEMIAPGEGLLVSPGDAVALSAALISLLRDGDAARDIGGRARLAVSQRFRLDQTADRFEDLYRRLAATGSTGQWLRAPRCTRRRGPTAKARG
jgi:glycosyltransferase involved in cell wall biosynthesis